jgi:hypothetical protein
MTLPTPGSQLTGSSATFDWTAGTGVTAYKLYVGTSGAGSYNLLNSGSITALTAGVTGIPSNGVSVNVRLFSEINGTWQYQDYTYTETGTPAPAVLSTPTAGSTLAATGATFTWTTGTGVTAYYLTLGTTGLGASDLYSSGKTTSTFATVGSLPAYGITVYARLSSVINGAKQYQDYTFLESGSPVAAVMSSPTPGSTLSGSSVAFTWTAGGGVSSYEIKVGTTGAGSYNIYNSGSTSALGETVSGLPTNGGTVYVRLYSKINGAWRSIDYTYTAHSPTT